MTNETNELLTWQERLLNELFPKEEDWACDEELEKRLDFVLNTLTGNEKYIILARFRDGYTLDEVGTQLGVTRERIRQQQEKALRKLKHPQRYGVLKYGEDYEPYRDKLMAIRQQSKERKEQWDLLKAQVDYEQQELERLNKELNLQGVTYLSLRNIEMSTRLCNTLLRNGLKYLNEVQKYSRRDVMKFRYMGKGSLKELEELLAKHNMKLKDE